LDVGCKDNILIENSKNCHGKKLLINNPAIPSVSLCGKSDNPYLWPLKVKIAASIVFFFLLMFPSTLFL